MERSIYIEITPFFPTSKSFRGSFIYDQVKALQKTGKFDEVLVFRPSSIYIKEKYYIYDGIIVYLFPCIQSPSYILNGIFDSINQVLFKKWFNRNFKFPLNHIKVAHAHVSTFAIYPLLLKDMNSNIKTVIQHHDLDPYTIRNGKWADKYWNIRFKYNRNKEVFEKIDYHLCVSDKVRDSLLAFPKPRKGEIYQSYLSRLKKIENLPTAQIKNTIVLFNGVDRNIFYKIDKKKEPIYKIGCIANFVDLKDQKTLLEAMRILIKEKGYINIHLSLIGSGPLLEECKTYVSSYKLDEYVSFETEVFHENLSTYYQSLNLFVLPSYFEGFGCVLAEAASCGVPFITCENQGIESYIPIAERNKWFFPAKDYIRLASLIINQIEKQEKQTFTASFDIDILIQKYLTEIDA